MAETELESLRKQYGEPLCLHIASMKITDIGRAAKKVDKLYRKALKNEPDDVDKAANDASQVILGLQLRLARNMMRIADQSTRQEVADAHNMSSADLNEYHFVGPAIAGLNALISNSTDSPDITKYISRYGFLAGVKLMVETSNLILEVMSR